MPRMLNIQMQDGQVIDVSDYPEGQALPMQTVSRDDIANSIQTSIDFSNALFTGIFIKIGGGMFFVVITFAMILMVRQGDAEWYEFLPAYLGVAAFLGIVYFIQKIQSKHEKKLASSVETGQFRILRGHVQNKYKRHEPDEDHPRTDYFIKTKTASCVCTYACWHSLLNGDGVYIVQIETDGKYQNSYVMPEKSTRLTPDLKSYTSEE